MDKVSGLYNSCCLNLQVSPTQLKQILKPGGYWINLGPLQYHWYEFGATTNGSGIDPRYNESIELSFLSIFTLITFFINYYR